MPSSQQKVPAKRAGNSRPTLMIVEAAGKSQASLQKFFVDRDFGRLSPRILSGP